VKKVILICLSLMVSGCSDDTTPAIQSNLKECFSKAETEDDKTLCLEEAKSYREACFGFDMTGNAAPACRKLKRKHARRGE